MKTSSKNKIVVCHILNLITGKADGVYTHLKMLLNLIPRHEFEQIVIFQGGSIIEQDLTQIGIRYYVVPSLKKNGLIKSARSIYKIILNENVDIIQSHLVKPYILSGIVNFFTRKKHIFNYNGVFIDNEYYNFIEKVFLNILHNIINIFNMVDLAIVPSYFSKSILSHETNSFARIDVYYNGFDCSLTKDIDPALVKLLMDLKQKYFLVGIIARLEIQKRIDLSLMLLKELLNRKKNVYFVYIGDGPLENKCKELAVSLSVTHNSAFLGYVKNARNYIKHFDTLLFTSDWEGLPLTIWEAMANKVPIIATDVGGNKEIVYGETCGYIFPKGDIHSGANYLEKIINDEPLRKSFGDNGFRALSEKYSQNNFRSFFENLFKELCPPKL